MKNKTYKMIAKKTNETLVVHRPLKDVQRQNSIETKGGKNRIFLPSQKSHLAHTYLPKWSPTICPNICVIIHSGFINKNKLTGIILCHDNLPCSTKMLVPFHCFLGYSFM